MSASRRALSVKRRDPVRPSQILNVASPSPRGRRDDRSVGTERRADHPSRVPLKCQERPAADDRLAAIARGMELAARLLDPGTKERSRLASRCSRRYQIKAHASCTTAKQCSAFSS